MSSPAQKETNIPDLLGEEFHLYDLPVLCLALFGGYRLSRCGADGASALLAKAAGLYALGVALVFAARWVSVHVFLPGIMRAINASNATSVSVWSWTSLTMFAFIGIFPYVVVLAAVMLLTRCA